MKNRLVISLCVFTILAGTPSWGANKNAGTSAAPFLKMGGSARPTAMGNAFVGMADDVNATLLNPAGLAFLERPEITAMQAQVFQDIDYQYGAFAYPSSVGAIGISAQTLKVNDLDRRGTDESLLGNFDSLDSAYGLSYARVVTPRLSLGGTIRFIDQEIDTYSASTWGGDIGALYKFERWPVNFGFAIRNFGQKVTFQEESDPLPLTIVYGFGGRFLNDRLNVGLEARHPRDNDMQFGLGAEWNQRLVGEFRSALRAGYDSLGKDADGADGLTFGGGLGFKQFTFDMAWVPFGDLGNTIRYSATLRFQ